MAYATGVSFVGASQPVTPRSIADFRFHRTIIIIANIKPHLHRRPWVQCLVTQSLQLRPKSPDTHTYIHTRSEMESYNQQSSDLHFGSITTET